MDRQIDEIEKILGYPFKDRRLLALACVHRSYWNEHREEVEGHNERLEFLGDSVLNLFVAHALYRTQPDVTEGQLTQVRAQLVDCATCAKICHEMGLDRYLLLGRGEQGNVGRGRASIVGDFFEALLGALFLDGGWEGVLSSHIIKRIMAEQQSPAPNWKSQLQDCVQKRYQVTPTYQTLEESGPDHARYFRVAVLIKERVLAEGVGASKKEAQMQAAEKGYKNLN